MDEQTSHKTFKRELSGAILLAYFILLIVGIWSPGAFAASEAVKFEAFSFTALAFGMDSAAKQFKR